MAAEKPLAAQVALVTGGSRGIGLAIARQLGRMGARVALCARQGRPLRAAAAALADEGIEALAIRTDVARAPEVAALVRKTNAAFGPIDILVSNAGLGRFGPGHRMRESDWDRVLDTNLKGAFLCARAVAPQMIRRGAGHIIHIGSLAGKNVFAGGALYCASKWGLLGLSGCLAEDLRGSGIRVSAICPGSVATRFSRHAGKEAARMLRAEDVAHVVAMVVTQAPGSFVSEVVLRPTRKP